MIEEEGKADFSGKNVVVMLDEGQLRDIARQSAMEAFSEYESMKAKEMADKAKGDYANVKKLMEKYRVLKAHCEHTDPEVLEVDSICKINKTTGLMMSHVEQMVDAYESICISSGRESDKRKWKALYLYYIDEDCLTQDEIAEILYVDKRTVQRDIRDSLEIMACLILGIVGMEYRNGRGVANVS